VYGALEKFVQNILSRKKSCAQNFSGYSVNNDEQEKDKKLPLQKKSFLSIPINSDREQGRVDHYPT